MTGESIQGRTVAFLLTDGFEQVELTEPWKAVQEAGGTPVLVSPKADTVQGLDHIDKADTFDVDVQVKDANAADYDALVLPGGVVNADDIRVDADAVAFAKAFFTAGKPVAAICHAPWLLIEAGVVDGRRMTSYPTLATDLRNAGAEWVDEEVVVDSGFITSRNPGDLPAFNAKLIEEIAEGEHDEQHA
ncbi:type 1 glutamine amidotransferase domain-containing protein [Clavibacter sp. km1a]|uniref:type 1 glutamine amidotransferase domain-containing protein n=1 Tax=Clavibacter sp. km1a TaxID=3459136 RepID=UPI004041F2F9